MIEVVYAIEFPDDTRVLSVYREFKFATIILLEPMNENMSSSKQRVLTNANVCMDENIILELCRKHDVSFTLKKITNVECVSAMCDELEKN
jgi:hypothetical protein